MTSEHDSPSDGAETALEDPESPTDSTATPSPGDARPSRMAAISPVTDRFLANWRSILLAVSVIAAVGLAAGVFFFQYRPDQQIDDAAAQRAIRAASDGAVAVLSYSSDSLDRDFANAKADLTGRLSDLLQQVHSGDRRAGGAREAPDPDGRRGSGGRIRTAPGLSRRAGVPQRDHHRKGQGTTPDNPEQRANNAHEGQRFLADLEVGSIRMTVSGFRGDGE